MNKLMLIVLLSLAAAGCATSSMKSTPFYTGSERIYTGRVEDRVNLWPFAYYREPALSVLWPLFSQTDDHFAVRPIYSQFRQGGKGSDYDEFNFLWPFFQIDTRHHSHRAFPVFWGKDYFDVFPLVWNHGDSHCLFPLVWWREDEYFDVFPLFWKTKSMLALLPLFYTDRSETYVFPSFYRNKDVVAFFPFYERDTSGGELTEWFGPAGHHRGKENSHWFLPFYYRGENSLWTPLFGFDRLAHSSWALPFYYRGKDSFVSLPWISSERDGATGWAIPPLLSFGERNDEESYSSYLLGLAGHTSKVSGGSSQWLLPFFWRDDSMLVTPLGGYDRSVDGTWVFPFYYNDRDEFLSFFYWRRTREEDGRRVFDSHGTFPFWYADEDTFASPLFVSSKHGDESRWFVPPLLSWGASAGDKWTQRYLLGLYAREGKGDDSSSWLFPLYYSAKDRFVTPLYGQTAKSNWLFPLWYKDESKFISPFWGWSRSGHFDNYVVPPLLSWMERSERGEKKMRFLLGLGGVNTKEDGDVDCSWVIPLYYNDDNAFISLPFTHVKDDYTFVTPFFGVRHGEHEKGAWLWPLFGWTNDARMEAAEAMLNAETLDSKVKLEKHEIEWRGEMHQWHTVEGGARAHDESWRLSGLSTSDRWISWSASDDGKTVSGKETSDFGNFFAYKSDSTRTVTFDYATKKKISDEENGESGLFCNLLWHSKHEEGDGHEYDMKSVLWRFWHYEKLNGDVTVDSFPFFTYDSKTNGYSKTSLCWRLFRNEYDSKEDKRKVDVLFVPVWR